MEATARKKPFDDPEWSFEPRWSGTRTIATCDETTSLVASNNTDVTAKFPELARLRERLVAFNAMLDGIILDIETPVTYMVFDLIYLDGRRLLNLPFEERRRLLEETLVPSERVQLSPITTGEGVALFDAATAQGLRGIVAKEQSSLYRPGTKTKSWLEISTHNQAGA